MDLIIGIIIIAIIVSVAGFLLKSAVKVGVVLVIAVTLYIIFFGNGLPLVEKAASYLPAGGEEIVEIYEDAKDKMEEIHFDISGNEELEKEAEDVKIK